MLEIGQQALISMISHLIFIIITWQVIQSLRLDPIFKKMRTFEAKVLIIFVTIAIGTTVSNFVLDFFRWSQQITNLF
ncbi:hypothetical protein Pryu01_00877 [Paraliobacillus ryukyuensis]|uniref:Putative integral membrane protein (TIGR02327 family) n=1 Tax=Paraliobacillus ryukyuensis TaxID=200904 RepID=A0A366EFN9_9BACI|nr:DUF1146 family protein [Paraliobacillus ryukyuensis]RBP00550.1 putative integral membrane protein (TIGR02327 family) [Paraliobacillus ryukyuensis]